ncbi:hypothetical protein D3C78_1466280 [compost metagenome]
MILSIYVQLRKLAIEFIVDDIKIVQLVLQERRVSCRASQQTKMFVQFVKIGIVFFHFRI